MSTFIDTRMKRTALLMDLYIYIYIHSYIYFIYLFICLFIYLFIFYVLLAADKRLILGPIITDRHKTNNGKKAGHEPAGCAWSPETQWYPGQKMCGRWEWEVIVLLHSGWAPTWSTSSRPGAPSTSKMQSCWSRSREGPRRWSKGWSLSSQSACEERLRELGARRRDHCDLSVVEGSLQPRWRVTFYMVCKWWEKGKQFWTNWGYI